MTQERIKIKDAVFLIYDTESTGVTDNDRPIELAAIKFNIYSGIIGDVKDSFNTLINPKMHIHPSAIGIHGLFDKDVAEQPTLQEVLPSFLEFVGDNTTLVAHNLDFDLKMVPVLFDDKYKKADNLKLVRKVYQIGDLGFNQQDLRSHKEQELRYWLNINVDTHGLPAHRALSDILVLSEIFKDAAIKLIQKHNIEFLDEFIDIVQAPVLKEVITFGKYKDFNIVEAIHKEKGSPRNYFKWLIEEISVGKMKIDSELEYSIKYQLNKEDPELAKVLLKDSKPLPKPY